MAQRSFHAQIQKGRRPYSTVSPKISMELPKVTCKSQCVLTSGRRTRSSTNVASSKRTASQRLFTKF